MTEKVLEEDVCQHVCFGSSQLDKFRRGRLTLKDVHQRYYHYGAKSEGSVYEDIAK